MTGNYTGASASYATFEDVDILRRQIVTLQETVALHDRHLTAHDESLASGDRMFTAMNRHGEVLFQLSLWIALLALIALGVGVTALVIA